jgi:hypothetical protein
VQFLPRQTDPRARLTVLGLGIKPSAVTRPEAGETIPPMMLTSVELPAPLGPNTAKISPSPIDKATGFSASTPLL